MPQLAGVLALAPHMPGRGRDARALAAVAGSDPRIRHASYGTAMVGMCTATHPSPGVAPGSSNPVREGQTAIRDGLVPVLRADAEQPHGQPVGERVVRRLEAALEPPSRAGIAGLGATRGVGARGAQTRTAPNPQQSLGLPGRSQPRLRVPCGPSRPDNKAQDLCAQRLQPTGRCARLERRGAQPHPMSFSRAYAAMTRAAGGAQLATKRSRRVSPRWRGAPPPLPARSTCGWGSKGAERPPASPPCSTRSRRIAKGLNDGRESYKVLRGCTICVSCRWTGPCWTVRRKREKRT